MQYLHSALALCARKIYGGVVYAVGYVAVLYIVHKLVRGHNGAVVLRLGRARAKVGHAYAVFNAYQLCIGEVGYVARNLSAFKRGNHIVGIHKFAAAVVNNNYAVLHLRYRLGVNHALRVVCKGHMQR